MQAVPAFGCGHERDAQQRADLLQHVCLQRVRVADGRDQHDRTRGPAPGVFRLVHEPRPHHRLPGIGEAEGELSEFFGSNPGQLKSNVSYNGGEPYNVTDQDIIDSGIEPNEDGIVGEFHINIVPGATVAFDYELPPKDPALL